MTSQITKNGTKVLVSGCPYQGINGVNVQVWLDSGKGEIRHWITNAVTLEEAKNLKRKIIEIFDDGTYKVLEEKYYEF